MLHIMFYFLMYMSVLEILDEVLKRLPDEFIDVMLKFYQKFVEKDVR